MGQVVIVDGVEYTTHAPIGIYSNADFTPENGVTGGSGTEADPWIIEGWDIDGSVENYCISAGSHVYDSINDTEYGGVTDPFIIRNCNIYNANEDSGSGISLYYIQNVTIYDNNIYDNNEGIYIRESSNNIIESNDISLNNVGFYFLYGEKITLANNHLFDNGYVISTFASDFNVIINNTFSYNGGGISMRSSINNTISLNNISNNNGQGISLQYSTSYNNITNNIIENNTGTGIEISVSSYYNNIQNNTVSDNDKGIILDGASYTNMKNNTLSRLTNTLYQNET